MGEAAGELADGFELLRLPQLFLGDQAVAHLGFELPRALGDALSAVLEDPALAGRLAEAGRSRYEAEFAAGPVLARWQAFLRTVEKS